MIVVCGEPDEADWGDILFAWRVCKHVTSNAIVIAKDLCTIGIGAGQMSRVDAVRIAVDKARELGHDPEGSTLASDAFFPFPDGPDARPPCRRAGDHPARRLEARLGRGRHRRVGRRDDGLHRPPALPPLTETPAGRGPSGHGGGLSPDTSVLATLRSGMAAGLSQSRPPPATAGNPPGRVRSGRGRGQSPDMSFGRESHRSVAVRSRQWRPRPSRTSSPRASASRRT